MHYDDSQRKHKEDELRLLELNGQLQEIQNTTRDIHDEAVVTAQKTAILEEQIGAARNAVGAANRRAKSLVDNMGLTKQWCCIATLFAVLFVLVVLLLIL